jgi:hypothetical protein
MITNLIAIKTYLSHIVSKNTEKNKIIKKVNSLISLCSDFVNSIKNEDDDPWDTYDIDNWAGMIYTLDEVEKSIVGLRKNPAKGDCAICGKPVTKGQRSMRDEDFTYHMSCLPDGQLSEGLLAKLRKKKKGVCAICGKPVVKGQRSMRDEDFTYHVSCLPDGKLSAKLLDSLRKNPSKNPLETYYMGLWFRTNSPQKVVADIEKYFQSRKIPFDRSDPGEEEHEFSLDTTGYNEDDPDVVCPKCGAANQYEVDPKMTSRIVCSKCGTRWKD